MAGYNGTGMAQNYMPNIGQNYTPYQTMYDAQQQKLQQMQQQYNEQYAPQPLQQVQPAPLKFDCVAVANKEELLARPVTNPDMPIIGTNFMNDVIFVKGADGTIERYELVEEPEPQVTLPDGVVSAEAHNEVVNRVNELSTIIIAIKDELDTKSIELDTKISENDAEIAIINEQLTSSEEEFESELDKRIAALRQELNGEIDNAKQVWESTKNDKPNAPDAGDATTIKPDAKPASNVGASTKTNANRRGSKKPGSNADAKPIEGEAKTTTRE